jgi:hypothetical protein
VGAVDRPAADIALDVRELGAAYLGGTRLGPLSAAMTWDPAPWCPMIF